MKNNRAKYWEVNGDPNSPTSQNISSDFHLIMYLQYNMSKDLIIFTLTTTYRVLYENNELVNFCGCLQVMLISKNKLHDFRYCVSIATKIVSFALFCQVQS